MPPTLVPDARQLGLLCLTASETVITMVVQTTSAEVPCPLCQQPSHRPHSRYQRTLADLPWQGIAVQVRLQTRRFFCDNASCERRIFTERIPPVAAPYARRTARLAAWLTQVAFALGGAPGVRLLRRSGCWVSRETLLGHIRRFPGHPSPTPTVLSLDDFAVHKGHTYGTIFVDLERHGVVDLVPERSADVVATWLSQHPGVQVISRDRGGEYAEGARRGAPEAIQVADRFHLLQNLGDATRRVLRRHAAVVQRLPVPGSAQVGLTHHRLDRQASKQRTTATMRERFEQIHALAGKGWSKNAIARHLGVNRKTAYQYLALAAPPERRHVWRGGSALAPYEGYILRRWEQGCRNGRELWRDLMAQGYSGAYQNVARIMAYLRQRERQGESSPPPPSGLTPRQAVGLVLQRPDDRTEDERHTVDQLRALHPEIRHAVFALERFAQVLRKTPHDHPEQTLDHWIAEVADGGLPEFAAFVTKLQQDRAAVLAALRLPWSQGQTEGQITELKLLKRSMYGRAGFDLLRQRVLYASPAA